MASITSQLIVSLIDQVSGPARQVGAAFAGMSRKIKEASGPLTFTERLNAQMTRTNRQIAQARGQLVDAVAGFYALKAALGAPIGNAMEVESTMSGIASKAGLSAEKTSELRGALRDASKATNQHTIELAKAVDRLVGMGMSADDAVTAINDIGAASTATGANVIDMADAGFAAISNLKVPADDLMKALDAMAMAGKRGGFELKDMASYFPNVGSAYAALGQTGTGAVADLAAAMQIMRKNTGDASSAATNLQNVIQKMQSPATVNAFKKMGVNLEAELKAAAEAGLTPLEAIAEITAKALKGDLSKIGYLFEDSQAQAGVRSLIQNMEEFRSIRAEAMGADGNIMADFARMMQTTAEQVKTAQIAFSNLSETIGNSLLPAVRELAGAVTPIVEGFTKLVENNPALVAGLALTAGGFIALRTAMAGLTFLGLMGKGGMLATMAFGLRGVTAALVGLRAVAITAPLALLSGGLASLRGSLLGLAMIGQAGGLSAVFSTLGSGLLSLLNPMNLVTAAAVALRGAVMLTGVGAILIGIAMAGKFIYDNWQGIKEMFSAFGQAFMAAIGPAKPMLDPLISAVGTLFGWISKLNFEISPAKWQEWGAAAGTVIGQIVAWFAELPARIAAAIGSLFDIGRQMMQSFFDGIVSVANDILGYVSGIGSKIKSALSFGGAEGVSSDPMGSGIDGQRAKGGPISRGGSYLVGEQGPELITAGRSGYVNKAGSFPAGGITINQSMVFNIDGSASEDVVEKIRRVMKDEVRETFRGVFSDTGLRFA